MRDILVAASLPEDRACSWCLNGPRREVLAGDGPSCQQMGLIPLRWGSRIGIEILQTPHNPGQEQMTAGTAMTMSRCTDSGLWLAQASGVERLVRCVTCWRQHHSP